MISSALTGIALALIAALVILTPAGQKTWGNIATHFGWAEPAQTWEDTPRPPAYYPKANDTSGLSEEDIRQIAYDVCPRALGLGNCLDYSVEIVDLNGAFGAVEVSWERPQEGASAADVALTTSGVRLDRSLASKPAQYVANVAAHEWNHIEQALTVKTLEGRNALKKRAYDHYSAKAPGGLPREDLGVEILTDCMTVMGDNVPAGISDSIAPHYVKTYMGSMGTAEACNNWQSVLHGDGE